MMLVTHAPDWAGAHGTGRGVYRSETNAKVLLLSFFLSQMVYEYFIPISLSGLFSFSFSSVFPFFSFLVVVVVVACDGGGQPAGGQ